MNTSYTQEVCMDTIKTTRPLTAGTIAPGL